MRNIFLAAILFLSQTVFAGPIGTLGTLPTLSIGGRVFTDSTTNPNFIILYCATGSSGNYCTFRTANGTAGHQVAGGKTLYIYAYRITFATQATGSGNTGQILQSANDTGINTTTPPTSPVYLYGNGTNGLGIFVLNATGGAFAEGVLDFQVSSGNYATVANVSGGGLTYQLFGYEM